MVNSLHLVSFVKSNIKCSLFQDDEIRDNVTQYLPEISDVLNRVPRPMLMLFKTYDLLRGIETHLHTRANASSFITMSKCCVHAVYEHKRKKCETRFGKVRLFVEEYWKLFQITCYEFYLWWMESKEQHKQVVKDVKVVKAQLKDKATEIYQESKDKAKEKVEKQKEKLEEHKEILKEIAKEKVDKQKEKLEEHKEILKDKAKEKVDKHKEKFEEHKDNLKAKTVEIIHKSKSQTSLEDELR